MKLTILLLTAGFLNVHATGLSQEVTFSGKGVSLRKVFAAIESQTAYTVVYEGRLLRNTKPVSITASKKPLDEFLREVLFNQSLEFAIENTTIIISRANLTADLSPRPSSSAANPPSSPIRGRVVNEKGEPVAGVSVVVKGSSVGTTTNDNGEFQLTDINEDATLVFTSTNIEKLEFSLRNRNRGLKSAATTSGTSTTDLLNLTIGVKVRSSILDEVQVIPYGTQTKRFSVGNVTTVKGEDIAKQPVNNPLLALAGRVPGLFITQNTGVPGGAVTVRVQGQNSIRLQGNEPFYLIDGVPFLSSLPGVGSDDIIKNGNPLNFINTADIESITVLKDADATAIYGSRAANGAILITTKKGKIGKTGINVDIQHGLGKVRRKINMLNLRQYLDMRYEAFKNDGIDWTHPDIAANDLKVWDTTRYTDWQSTLIGGTARYDNISTSISGGTSLMQYLVGGTWHRESSVFPGSFADQKGAMHFNISSETSNRKFRLQLSGSYLFDDNKLPVRDLTSRAISYEPVAPPIYNADGTLNWAIDGTGRATWENPLIYKLYNTYSNKTNNLVSSFHVDYAILPGLNFNATAGYTNMQTATFSPIPMGAIAPHRRGSTPRSAVYGQRNITSWNIEPQIKYQHTIWKGVVDALAGASLSQNKSISQTINGSGYSSDLVLEDIESASSVRLEEGSAGYKYNALFGRFNYRLFEKYLVNATIRRDGSSRFGDNNRFHNFWSVGGGWILTQEDFFENNIGILSFGKIRASYGTTGNDQIGDYHFLGLYGSNSNYLPYQNVVGLTPSNLPNPYIQWEETRKIQLGVDLGILNDRIVFNATYSRNRSSNQLIDYRLPSITGFVGVVDNFPATVQNRTWEFILSLSNIKKKTFSWTSSLNVSIPDNKLISFPNIENSTYNTNLVVGEPLDVIKQFHFLGVDSETGLYLVADHEGKPTTTPDYTTDQTVLISTLPKYYGGFQNSIVYRGVQFDFLFQFVKQKGANVFFSNSFRAPGEFTRGASNQPATVMERWQNPGDITPIQQFSSTSNAISTIYNATSSDAAYSDASFIRLKTASISYQVPSKIQQKLHMQSCSVYMSGQNLLTFTGYQGMDPENRSISSLPPLQMFTAGIRVTY